MRVALLGYGKMGEKIEEILKQRNHVISGRINSKNKETLLDVLKKSDVAIEFSTPHTAIENITQTIDNNIPLIVGTTGWYSKVEEIKTLVNSKNGALVYASNFSIGVNLFFELNKKLAKMMQSYSSYNVEIEEVHHTRKMDAPSGTAISLAKDILENNNSKKDWTLNTLENNELLKIVAKRVGDTIGKHSIRYFSDTDEIMIQHNAFNRNGFALGAVIAAEWIIGKKGFYEFKEVLNIE